MSHPTLSKPSRPRKMNCYTFWEQPAVPKSFPSSFVTPSYGSKEWNDFIEAVRNFSEDWSAVTTRSSEISLVEPNTSGGGENMFSTLVERMDKAITTLWRGADLGTSSKTNSTGASLQADETNILETDDARIADETLTAQVSRYALAWKFGPDTPQLAYLKIRVPETKNVDLELKTDQFLVAAGAPLGVKNALERYGRQFPEPGEATLTAPPTTAPTPLFPTGEEGRPVRRNFSEGGGEAEVPIRIL